VTFTPAALEKVREYLAREERSAVRIDLNPDATISLELDRQRGADRVLDLAGVRLVVAPDLIALARGLDVDWRTEGRVEGFAFGGNALILDRAIASRALPRPPLRA
jgi:Fe-S cluster assembly iron-binding protein IscA